MFQSAFIPLVAPQARSVDRVRRRTKNCSSRSKISCKIERPSLHWSYDRHGNRMSWWPLPIALHLRTRKNKKRAHQNPAKFKLRFPLQPYNHLLQHTVSHVHCDDLSALGAAFMITIQYSSELICFTHVLYAAIIIILAIVYMTLSVIN